MKITLSLPPDGSFLSSTIYEGVLRLLVAGAKIKNEKTIETPPSAIQKAYADIADIVGEKLTLQSTGVNDFDHIMKLLNLFLGKIKSCDEIKKKRKKKRKGGGKIKYATVIKTIAETNHGWNCLRDTDISLEFNNKETIILVGARDKESALQLPVFKPDRYKGFRLPEASIVNGLYQFGLGIEAAIIGLLGLGGAHVISLGKSHYFLFIDPSQITHIIASSLIGLNPARLAKAYLVARDAGAEALRSLEDALTYPEAAVSRLLLDVGVRRALRDGNIRMLSLRLVRIDEERTTYKIYSETPLTVTAEEVKYAEVLIKHLDPKKSPLMKCLIKEAKKKGSKREREEACKEGQHAVEAVMWLFRYVSTGSKYFLSQYLRELVTAASVAEASEGGARRAPLYRGLAATLLRVMK